MSTPSTAGMHGHPVGAGGTRDGSGLDLCNRLRNVIEAGSSTLFRTVARAEISVRCLPALRCDLPTCCSLEAGTVGDLLTLSAGRVSSPNFDIVREYSKAVDETRQRMKARRTLRGGNGEVSRQGAGDVAAWDVADDVGCAAATIPAAPRSRPAVPRTTAAIRGDRWQGEQLKTAYLGALYSSPSKDSSRRSNKTHPEITIKANGIAAGTGRH